VVESLQDILGPENPEDGADDSQLSSGSDEMVMEMEDLGNRAVMADNDLSGQGRV